MTQSSELHMQMAGARAVPIQYDLPKEEVKKRHAAIPPGQVT